MVAGETALAVQEEGGRRVGLFEQQIRRAGRVLIVLTLLAITGLLGLQVDAPLKASDGL